MSNSRELIPVRLAAVCMLALSLCVLNSCRTSRVRKAETREYALEMLSAPEVTDLSGKFSVTYGTSGPFTIKARMRWDKCIHLSYSVLGLMEVAAVDILPDKVVLANKVNGVYSELAFSDIPYIGVAKADFRTVQGLLWNRLSVYGKSSPDEAAQHIDLLLSDSGTGRKILSDDISDFRFEVDGDGNIVSVSKSVPLCKVSAGYSGFREVDNGFRLPERMNVNVTYGSNATGVKVRYVGFSSASAREDIMIDISSLGKIPFSEMVKIVKRYL